MNKNIGKYIIHHNSEPLGITN